MFLSPPRAKPNPGKPNLILTEPKLTYEATL